MSTATISRTTPTRRVDLAHHHPHVRRAATGWAWSCSCGAASGRTGALPTWRRALISALNHAVTLSP